VRRAAGFTQPRLAEAVGVPVASLRNWEQGRTEPPLFEAWQIAQALGISLDALAGDVFKESAEKKRRPRKHKSKGEAP
jgi:transcriptional regulator with XRE-family HTH domain